jgi:hypothetical protein
MRIILPFAVFYASLYNCVCAQKSTNQLLAPDGAQYDQFGVSSSIDDDGLTIAVSSLPQHGLTGDIGALYLFEWNGSNWNCTAEFKLNSTTRDQVGYANTLSSDGRVAFLGAPSLWISPGFAVGAVFAFVKTGTAWSGPVQMLSPADDGSSDWFGRSIATTTDGSIVLVGAPGENVNGGSLSGAIYFWNNTVAHPNTWQQRQQILAPESGNGCLFGSAVAIDRAGTMAVVGAPGCESGAAHVYAVNVSGAWTLAQTLLPSNGALYDNYGMAVAVLPGSILVVGSMWHQVGTNYQQGAAYIYTWNGTAWGNETLLAASDGQPGDWFGCALALSADGNTLAVGAVYRHGTGGAFVFTRNSITWVQQELKPGINSLAFGASIALNAFGNVTVVGIQQSTIGDNPGQGDAAVVTF